MTDRQYFNREQHEELAHLIYAFVAEYQRQIEQHLDSIPVQRVVDGQPFFRPQISQPSFPEYLSNRLLSAGLCFEKAVLSLFLEFIKNELNFTEKDDTTFLDALLDKFIKENRDISF